MRIRGPARGGQRGLLLPLAGLLGAAVVVLPSVASSETSPTIEASKSGVYFRWQPSTATVNAGGAVTFANPSTEVNHGVEWRPGRPTTPSCTGGVPVGTSEAASGANWSGTCTFNTPGTYTFWCTVHHQEMSGSITVNANGTTTTTTTTGTGTGTQTSTAGGGPSTGTATPTELSSQGGSASPLAGSASEAVRLSAKQHGKSVRGSVAISPAGVGARLEVDLLAKSASLAAAGHAARVRVGRVLRASLPAGKVSFSVPLSARARRAVRRHHRLALSVTLTINAPGGASVTLTRAVVVRP
jgi:plastocyanin